MKAKSLVWVAASALLSACAADPILIDNDTVPDLASASVRPSDGNIFRLRPEQIAASADGGLFVTFRGVSNDSRCPADVVCVWAGNAEAGIGTARAGQPWSFATLNTGVEPKSLTVGSYTVTLTNIEPVARQGGIPAAEYLAVLTISRR